MLSILKDPSIGISEKLVIALAIVLAAVGAIVLHEVSHGYVAKLNGDLTAKARGRLTLNPIAHFDPVGLIALLLIGFGWAKPVPIDSRNFTNYKRGMITVSIAGVTTNILLAGISALLLFLLGKPILSLMASPSGIAYIFGNLFVYYFIFSIQINLMLALFNLLPIYPLDGYNLINTFLPYNNGYQKFMVKYGFFILIGLILIGQLGQIINVPQMDIFGMFGGLANDFAELVLRAAWI